MKKLCFIFILLLLLGFTSCNCDKTYNCETLSDEGLSLLKFNVNDSVKFTNNFGQHIVFRAISKIISQPYVESACKGGNLTCSCSYDCEASGGLILECDTAISNFYYYRITVNETGSEVSTYKRTTFDLSYNILDFTDKINLLGPILDIDDTLALSLSLGNNTYSNVYIQAHDTLNIYYQNNRVWKAYYTKSDGVIGFWDRQSQSLYFKE